MCDWNRMHDMAKQLHIMIFQMLIFSLIYLVTTLSPPTPTLQTCILHKNTLGKVRSTSFLVLDGEQEAKKVTRAEQKGV
jgi:hypothetical protein